MGSKILITYFSCSGVTKEVAGEIASEVAGDMFEILPEVPYTSADLNWMNKKSRSSVEMKDPTFRPVIASTIDNFARYDTVFIGFPIWWYTFPSIINTFLESYDFNGKTVIPFATSGSSGLGQIEQNFKKACKDNVFWKKAEVFKGGSDRKKMVAWLENLDL